MPEKLLKFFPLVKVDEAAHMVWGVATSEAPDAEGEICDYPEAKLEIKKWSDDTLAKTIAAGQDPSLGNMRVMHQLEVGGKAIKIEYKDDSKQIWVGSEPANDEVWHLLKGGFLTGHSIGGAYKWKRKEGEYVRFAPTIGEISYVDKGSNPEASFSYVKADGSTELRKFAKPGPEEEKILAKIRASELQKLTQSDIDRIAKAVRDSVEQTEPTAILAELKKQLDARGIEMGTELQTFSAALARIMGQSSAAGGSMKLTTEQLKKAAEALGITPEEFAKQIAETVVPSDALAKAKGGLAALHGHMESAQSHHEAMHKAHGAMGSMHEKMATHLGKCLKACKAVMGDDEKESEKALHALVDELKKAAPAADPDPAAAAAAKAAADAAAAAAAAGGEKFDKAVVEAMLKKQAEEFEKKIGELPAPDPKGLRIVPRASAEEVKKAQESGIPEALPAV